MIFALKETILFVRFIINRLSQILRLKLLMIQFHIVNIIQVRLKLKFKVFILLIKFFLILEIVKKIDGVDVETLFRSAKESISKNLLDLEITDQKTIV